MAFDKAEHVVIANGEAWIQIDALIRLLADAKGEFIRQGLESLNMDAPAVATGCAFVCDELRIQLIKLSIQP